jgi:Ca2+/Na+ antiporter
MQLITGIPLSLFALTIIAWGNCLGDMSADVAMTKKGFGEMAIAGTMAGPIFNILMGQGLSLTLGIIQKGSKMEEGIMGLKFDVSAFNKGDGSFDMDNAVIPVTLLVSLSTVLIILLINALTHKYKVDFKWSLFGSGLYFLVIFGLVVETLVMKALKAKDDK